MNLLRKIKDTKRQVREIYILGCVNQVDDTAQQMARKRIRVNKFDRIKIQSNECSD